MNKNATIAEVIEIVRGVNADQPAPVGPQTRILAELDLDSLKMIELMDVLKARYGVDFSAAPQSLDDLRSPETIAAALIRARDG
jgi:acyl carrier protein